MLLYVFVILVLYSLNRSTNWPHGISFCSNVKHQGRRSISKGPFVSRLSLCTFCLSLFWLKWGEQIPVYSEGSGKTLVLPGQQSLHAEKSILKRTLSAYVRLSKSSKDGDHFFENFHIY